VVDLVDVVTLLQELQSLGAQFEQASVFMIPKDTL